MSRCEPGDYVKVEFKDELELVGEWMWRSCRCGASAGGSAAWCANRCLQPWPPIKLWSVDFMSDTLSSGQRFRTLNIVYDYTRECLTIEVDTSLDGMRVVRVLVCHQQRANSG